MFKENVIWKKSGYTFDLPMTLLPHTISSVLALISSLLGSLSYGNLLLFFSNTYTHTFE